MAHALLRDNPDLKTAIDIYDAWIRHTMHKKHQPGLAIGLVHNGELLWGKGFGFADLDTKIPVNLDTPLPHRQHHKNLHRHRHLATEGCRQAQSGRPGIRLIWIGTTCNSPARHR